METPKRPLTYDDFWNLKVPSDVRIAPDGKRAAFVVSVLDRDSDEQTASIWIVDLDRSDPRQFTAGTKRDMQPRWSPDGQCLAFASNRSGEKQQIYVMSPTGGEPVQVTESKEGAHTPVWSPDSKKIAYLVNTRFEGQRVESERLWAEERDDRRDQAQLRRLTRLKERFDGIGWLDTRSHIFVVDREGGESIQLTEGDASDTEPTWSPGGQSIAFVSARRPDGDLSEAADIWTVDIDTGELTCLTDGTLLATSPSWSPDGETVAFYAVPDITSGPVSNTHVWSVPGTGGGQRDLMPDFDNTLHSLLSDYSAPEVTPPLWSPDGESIYFTASVRGSETMCQVTSAGGGVTVRVEGDVHITAADLSPDGKEFLCCAQTLNQPLDLFRFPAQGGPLEQLTHLNGTLLDDVRIAPTQQFTFTSADGCEVDGWLVRPIGPHDPEVPLVLFIHGGPHGMYGNSFYYNLQVLAGQGVASFYANPRGSSGYGIDFMRACLQDWGGKPYEDLMAGVDRVIEMGGIDHRKMAVTGGSYGGYMTNWVVGQTDRFACAIAINSISDLVSFAGMTDIPQWLSREWGGPFWENWDLYRAQSPLSHITNVQTPLLLLHAEGDLRCPIEQSEEMYLALKRLRREVEMIRIPNAFHGLATTPAPRHRVERWRISKEWFDRYFGRERA